MDIKSLIAKMTLKEKLMQLTQLNAEFFLGQAGAEATGPMADLGLTKDDLSGIHSTLNFRGTDKVRQVQEKHLAADKHKIPMSFMMDVVHGCRTIYPLPIGMGATFSPETIADCCEMAARESLATRAGEESPKLPARTRFSTATWRKPKSRAITAAAYRRA